MKKVLTVLAVVLFIGLNVTIVSNKNENSKMNLNAIIKVVVANTEEEEEEYETHTRQECAICTTIYGQKGADYFCFTQYGPGQSESCFDQACSYGLC